MGKRQTEVERDIYVLRDREINWNTYTRIHTNIYIYIYIYIYIWGREIGERYRGTDRDRERYVLRDRKREREIANEMSIFLFGLVGLFLTQTGNYFDNESSRNVNMIFFSKYIKSLWWYLWVLRHANPCWVVLCRGRSSLCMLLYGFKWLLIIICWFS